MVDYSTYDHSLGVPDNSLAAAQWYYGSNYPDYDWNTYQPWTAANSQIVDTVYGPAYTPQPVNNPVYQGDWPYVPADYASEPGYWGGTYSAAGDQVPTTSSIYRSSYSAGGGGGGGGTGGFIGGTGPGFNLYEILRNLQALYPSLTTTPQEQYALSSPQAYTELASKVQGLLPWVDPRITQSNFEIVGGVPRSAGPDTLAPIREYVGKLAQTASSWAPGAEGIGDRRTLGQQANYEQAMNTAFQWGPNEAPLAPTGSSYKYEMDYANAVRNYQQQMAQLQTQQSAWDLWRPTLAKMFGPETWQEGGFDWLTPATPSGAPAPSRQAPVRPSSSSQSWSFAPRWG